MRFRETARRSRYGHAGPRAAIFIALAGSLAVCASGTSATGAKTKAPLSRRDLCCLPYSEAHSLGRESIPILKSMLSDPSEKERWPHIVGTIAYVGVPESFVVLRDFMWNRFSGVVDDDTFRALLAVPNVLGVIPGTTVTDFLEAAANPAFWDSLPWKERVYSRRQLSVLLSEVSINGLACNNSPRAAAILEQLERKPYSPRQIANIKEGIAINREIREKGLARFFENRRGF